MTVKHIVELFALDGRDFINEAYLNLLKREPDEHGLMYYLGRLAQGQSKAAVIVQLAKSSESRPLEEIPGLKKLMVDFKRSKKLFWRWFGRGSQVEVAIYTAMIKLAEIDAQLARMNQKMGSLEETLRIAASDYNQKMENLLHAIKPKPENSLHQVEQMNTSLLLAGQLEDDLPTADVDEMPERLKSIYLQLKLVAEKNKVNERL